MSSTCFARCHMQLLFLTNSQKGGTILHVQQTFNLFLLHSAIPEEETSGSKSKSNGKSNGKSKKKGKGRKGRALRTGMKRWALGGRE